MKYTYNSYTLVKEASEFNKHSPKEILQYAIAGLLYMPALREQIAKEIINGIHPDYKAICLDLEDFISDASLEQAEESLLAILQKLATALKNQVITVDELPLLFIRVRSPQQFERIFMTCQADLLEVITGFNFPKFDSSNCQAYLEVFQSVAGRSSQSLYFMPIIESDCIMNKQSRLAELSFLHEQLSHHSEAVLNIRVGATDFSNILGIRRSVHQTIYDVTMIADCFADILNIFARDYVCSGPVWEYFDSQGSQGAWSQGLQKELALDKLNGFIGKTCIHPSQLPYVLEENLVREEDYQDALTILEMSQEQGVAKSFQLNRMNEAKPHARWARKSYN